MKAGFSRRDVYAAVCLVVANATTCRDTPPPPEADSSPPAPTTVSSDSLAITLDAPATLAAGRSTTITIRLTNRTDRTLDLSLRGREIVFDLIVSRDDGAVVWRRLEGEVVPAILRLEQLAPGAELVLEATWDGRDQRGRPLPPGNYALRGEVLTDGATLVTPERRFRIE
jgi:hypothetical protein